MTPEEVESHAIPTAVPLPPTSLRPISRMWWATALCGLVAIALIAVSLRGTGQLVTIRFLHGHGIEPGGTVRLRGIDVGRVESVRVGHDLRHVEFAVRLMPEASGLAREGTEFWIERPRVGITGVSGLDTVVGAKYLIAEPGPPDAKSCLAFTGRETPPDQHALAEGVEFTLESPARYGLQVDAPVMYRGVSIGAVTHIGLASDAGSVETRIRIQSEYRALIRENSVFWPESGLDVRLGWSGVKLDTDSLASLAAGGVSVATPTEAGEPALGGHRFTLHAQSTAAWQTWHPRLPIGTRIQADAEIPAPWRATFTVARKRWGFTRTAQVTTWVHPLENGMLLCPSQFGDDTSVTSAVTLELEGRGIPLAAGAVRVMGLVAFLPGVPTTEPTAVWPTDRQRHPAGPEDCLLVAGHDSLPLAAARLQAGTTWPVEDSLELTAAWHGASVVARQDGALIGILLWLNGKAVVAPLPAK